jgi:hypothetical protein
MEMLESIRNSKAGPLMKRQSSFAFRGGSGDITVAGMQSEFSKYVSLRIGNGYLAGKISRRDCSIALFEIQTDDLERACDNRGMAGWVVSVLRLRQPSLVRGIVLSLGAFAVSLRLAGFPHIELLHRSNWQIAVLAAGLWGLAETARCLKRKWSLYHAGVLILLYTDLLILTMIIFLAVYP